MKNFKLLGSLFLTAGLILFTFNSCKKDPPPNNNNNNTGGTTEQYFILKGTKFVMKTPKTFKIRLVGSDTVLDWYGNAPTNDTGISIAHLGPRTVNVSYKIIDLGGDSNHVMIGMKRGIVIGDPDLVLDGGEYKLERSNGKWVSTVKNGTGYDTKDNSIKYTGIEIRVVWPD